MELTELEKKHAFSAQFMVNLWLYTIEHKYSMVMDEFKSAKEHYDNSDNEEEKAILTVKLQWLDAARITIEEEQEKRACNRKYKPLDIPTVVPAETEKKFTSPEEQERMVCNKTYKPLDIPKHSDANYSLREAQECIKKKFEDIQSHSRKISLDLVDDVKSFNIITDASFTLKGNEEHSLPITGNAEVEWHMDRVDAIREKQKSKTRKPKPIKNKNEFKHPSSMTINCIGVEAAYDTTEGREYRRKQNEEFEEFKRNNC